MPVLFLNDFSGGLHNKFRQNNIADNQSPNVRNASWTRLGAITKRPGTTRNVVTDGTGAAIARAFKAFNHQLGSQILIGTVPVGGGSVNIIRATSIGTYFDLITGLTQPAECEFLAFNNLVYVTNWADAVRSITSGNVVATPAGFPICRFFVVHKNYIFTYNISVSGQESRLQWSDRNTDTFTSTNFEDIYPRDGHVGSGIISFGDELIVFKSGGPALTSSDYAGSSMFSVIGNIFDATTPQYSINRVSLPYGVGLLSHSSIKIFNGRLIFLTNDGFYAYDGGLSSPYPISEELRGEIDNWTINTMNTNPRLSAVVYKNRYYCSVMGDSTLVPNASSSLFPNLVYVYDEKRWWKYQLGDTSDSFNFGSSAPADWVIFNGNLYGVGETGSDAASQGIIRQWETSSFTDTMTNGTAENVNLSFATKEYDFKLEKNFTHCFVHLRRQSSGTLTFGFNVNQRGEVTNSLDMTAPDSGSTENSSSNLFRKYVAINRRGRTIQFRAFDRGNNDVEIYGIELHYQNIVSSRDEPI